MCTWGSRSFCTSSQSLLLSARILLWYLITVVLYDYHDHGCGQRCHAALRTGIREPPPHCELTRRRHQCPHWIARCSSPSIQPKMALQLQPRTQSEWTRVSTSHIKKELAKLKKVWNQAKLLGDAKQKVDSVALAHGEPITTLTCDWISLMNQFKQKYGPHIRETRLPGQTYFEAYEEKLADGLLYPETPAQVISLAEENKQKALKPEVSRQMGLHLDNTLTIQTKRRFLSSMPATIEERRNKYQVVSHLWLLAQLRQPTRPLHADLKEISEKISCLSERLPFQK